MPETLLGYHYKFSAALVFCQGPVDKVGPLYVNATRALDATQYENNDNRFMDDPIWWNGAPGTVVSGNDNGDYSDGIRGYIHYLLGGYTQTALTWLANRLPDFTPTFRGAVTVLFEDFNIGQHKKLPPFSLNVQRIHTRQDGIGQWYDGYSEISDAQSMFEYQYVNPPVLGAVPTSGWLQGRGPFGDGTGAPPNPPNTDWDVADGIWLKKTYYVGEGQDVFALEIEVDNYAVIYWAETGTLIDSINSGDTEAARTFKRVFVGSRQPGEKTIAIYAQNRRAGATNTYIEVARRGNRHMNPAHIIREILTDPDWGMGYPDSDIDDTAFQNAAQTLYGEGFGLSFLWDDRTKCGKMLEEVVRHIDAAVYVDRATGKFTIKLIRDDYTPASLLSLNKSNVEAITEFTRPTLVEITNALALNYWNQDFDEMDTIELQDIALSIELGGQVVKTEVTYEGCPTWDLAQRMAQRDLKALSSPLVGCSITANSSANVLNVGDAFKLTWAELGLNEEIMRVAEINYGNGKDNRVKIKATQDVFALGDSVYLSQPTYISNGIAENIPDWVAFETPYLELISQFGKYIVDAALVNHPNLSRASVAAKKPSGLSTQYQIHVDEGTGYVATMIGNYAVAFFTTEDVGVNETAIDIDASEIPNTAVICQINDEIMRVESFVGGVLTVSRGYWDTVPGIHSNGDAVIFWEALNRSDLAQILGSTVPSQAALLPGEYEDPDDIDIKLEPLVGGPEVALDLADLTAKTVDFSSRAIKPYPPINFKVNAADYPALIATGADLTITWEHRDRTKTTTLLANGDTGETNPETGTTYTLRIYNDVMALVRTYSGITGTSQVYTNAQEVTDGGEYPTLTLELVAVRDGYESYYPITHTFDRF